MFFDIHAYNSLTSLFVLTGLAMGFLSLILGVIEVSNLLEIRKFAKRWLVFVLQFVSAVGMSLVAYFSNLPWFWVGTLGFGGAALVNLLVTLSQIEFDEKKYKQFLRILGWLAVFAIGLMGFIFITPVWWHSLTNFVSSLF